jgi:hypothetical protein
VSSLAGAAASALAEIPLQLCLIVMDVNSERWNEQALAAGYSPVKALFLALEHRAVTI